MVAACPARQRFELILPLEKLKAERGGRFLPTRHFLPVAPRSFCRWRPAKIYHAAVARNPLSALQNNGFRKNHMVINS